MTPQVLDDIELEEFDLENSPDDDEFSENDLQPSLRLADLLPQIHPEVRATRTMGNSRGSSLSLATLYKQAKEDNLISEEQHYH